MCLGVRDGFGAGWWDGAAGEIWCGSSKGTNQAQPTRARPLPDKMLLPLIIIVNLIDIVIIIVIVIIIIIVNIIVIVIVVASVLSAHYVYQIETSPPFDSKKCKKQTKKQRLPEVQRTRAIESKTLVFSATETNIHSIQLKR